ncbi:PR-1-like protein [Calocera cornea HHB12733]|uniref:PR-1-like protein n=1 Tax=Calocera cornea HHB12733 TaxID=1353952 RepID=A0A165HRM9_9BASI|nr:PR-1-like protein [Calocera cornea HHB12733]
MQAQALLLLLLLTALPALARPAKAHKGKRCRPRSATSSLVTSTSAPTTSEAPVVFVTTSTTTAEAAPTTSAAPVANVAPTPEPDSGSSGSSNSGSSNSGNSDSGSSSPAPTSDESAYLDPQNAERAQFGASPLTWNDTLASAAQGWANKCVFQHSLGALGPYGENLAAGTGSSFGVAQGIQLWLDEASQYNPSSPVASHWTQVVWKGSHQVGCAVAVCPGLLGAGFGDANFYVCEYFPEGNIIGDFAQNVQ